MRNVPVKANAACFLCVIITSAWTPWTTPTIKTFEEEP
jgi:hypothetical protein